MKTDIQIAREANALPILDIATKLNIAADGISQYGDNKAKLNSQFIKSLASNQNGKLILVTAINPTPAGEGKTTTSVGLTDGLNKIGKKAIVCLREPSLGPCFGMKGGAAGGGYAQVIPMEDINLHFTGDFHAITSAHNLLSAMIDNHLHWGNALNLDTRKIQWKRVIDMNDRSLRSIVIGTGGQANGVVRESGFDITPASEIMAILCLSNDIDDLKERIDNIIIGFDKDGKAVKAKELNASSAMTVLLENALKPNLVQTLENNPAFIHGGPFANIAHGCNTVLATQTALKLSDYVVTEAGFGADLGAEKFLHIKCRKSGLSPDAVVIVATIRALKYHGGVDLKELNHENVDAVIKGCDNLKRHIENIKSFGLPVVVAINSFVSDTPAETAKLTEICTQYNVPVETCTHWAEGSKGTEALANRVINIIETQSSELKFLYPDEMGLFEKVETLCTKIYRAGKVTATAKVKKQLAEFEAQGYGNLPVCIAKVQYSFSTDKDLIGAPEGHTVNIREVRLSAGAGFVVAVCGNVMTMPGLPRKPSAENIGFNAQGNIEGLF